MHRSPRLGRVSLGRRLTAGVVIAATLAGCTERSRVAPDAEIHVQGVVIAPDDKPLVNRPVKLGAGVGLDEGAVAVLTLGLSCTSGKCSGDVFDAATDADGRFDFTLRGRDTQSSFGEALSVLFSAAAEPRGGQVSGASVAARFRIQVPTLTLPVLRLVDPGLSLTAHGDVTARWSAGPGGPYELTFEQADEIPVWRVNRAELDAVVDPRVLEDGAGRAVVSGHFQDRVEGSDLDITWRSPGVPFVGGSGPPPSRGRPCAYTSATGTTTSPDDDCELTDGDLVDEAATPPVCVQTSATMATTACGAATAAIVDLGRAVPAELVVLRGCEGGCSAEVSSDGTTFRPAGTASDDFGVVALDGQPVRAVRIGVGADGGRLREVSVWGPKPTRPALQRLGDDDASRLREPFSAENGGAPSRVVFVAAAVLAMLIVAAVAYTVGRRRRA